jgi:hypothetical protein
MVERLLQVDTYYAPAPREPIDVIDMQLARVAGQPLLAVALRPR